MISSGLTQFAKVSKRPAMRVCSRRLWHFLLPTILLALVSTILAPGTCAQLPGTPTDIQVKAAYLYKFGAFVTWPSTPTKDSFAICILGQDPFGQTLDATLKGGSVGGKRLVAIRISGPQEASQCRIVFISSSEEPRLKSLLAVLNQVPVLTVSDIPRFADRGGMIEFVLEGSRVRFDVNLTSAENAGLSLSSELLKVASVVKRGEGRD